MDHGNGYQEVGVCAGPERLSVLLTPSSMAGPDAVSKQYTPSLYDWHPC